MVDDFLRWPLPDSVCADGCATRQGPGRVGTNLLSAVEAKAMLEAVVMPKLEAFSKQVTLIEDFLYGRGYCTELYISPLGFNGGEAWQVELNYGDSTEAFQGASVGEALALAIVAAMKRKSAQPA